MPGLAGWVARRALVLAGYIGGFQGRLLLTLLYFSVLLPFGLGVRLLADPLRTRQLGLDSGWSPRTIPSGDFSSVRRQF